MVLRYRSTVKTAWMPFVRDDDVFNQFWRYALIILCVKNTSKFDSNRVVFLLLICLCTISKLTRFCVIFGHENTHLLHKFNFVRFVFFLTHCWFAKPITYSANEFWCVRIDVSFEYFRMNAEKENRFFSLAPNIPNDPSKHPILFIFIDKNDSILYFKCEKIYWLLSLSSTLWIQLHFELPNKKNDKTSNEMKIKEEKDQCTIFYHFKLSRKRIFGIRVVLRNSESGSYGTLKYLPM